MSEQMNELQTTVPGGKPDIRSMTLAELRDFLSGLGEKPFRAAQLYRWMHVQMADSLEEMTNLSRDLRAKLAAEAELVTVKKLDVLVSGIDGTRKYLFELPDGNVIESVFMRYQHGNSVCVSSQAGCRMGCRFCASTLNGLARNLRASEILEQVYQIRRDTGERVSNVVIMGSGEPLDNYDAVVRFIRLLTGEDGQNISQRNVTLSTCGLVPGIRRLAGEGLSITLALSLHAPNDEIRKSLMPIAGTYPMEEVLDACADYFDRTGRRVTFEYSLAGGVNDSPENAEELARRIGKLHGHVNLIPVNPIRERSFVQSARPEINRFREILEKHGITATVRREMGRDINGACGQLRKSYIDTHAAGGGGQR